jgi:hypothetical protein
VGYAAARAAVWCVRCNKLTHKSLLQNRGLGGRSPGSAGSLSVDGAVSGMIL